MEPRSARQHGPAPGCAALGVVPVPVPVSSSPPPRRDTPGSVGHAGEAGSAASAAGPGAAARQSPPVLGWRGVLRAVTPPSWGGERRRAGERRWAMRTAGGAEGFRRGVPANCLWQGAGACWGTQGGSIPFSALSHFPDTTCTAPRSQSCWVHWGHRRPWEPLQGWRYHGAPHPRRQCVPPLRQLGERQPAGVLRVLSGCPAAMCAQLGESVKVARSISFGLPASCSQAPLSLQIISLSPDSWCCECGRTPHYSL